MAAGGDLVLSAREGDRQKICADLSYLHIGQVFAVGREVHPAGEFFAAVALVVGGRSESPGVAGRDPTVDVTYFPTRLFHFSIFLFGSDKATQQHGENRESTFPASGGVGWFHPRG